MLARYAAAVKNLRGVLVADLSSKGSWETVEWLVKRFRYRNLGLPPSIVSRFKSKLERYLNGRPFRELVYPASELKLVVKVYEMLGYPLELSEGLVLASTYISPLLVEGEHYTSALSEGVVHTIYTCKSLSVNDWKLHLRITDYSILDSYEESVDEALEFIGAIRSGNFDLVQRILERRKGKAKKDARRYWRISCGSGKAFLLYYDPIKAIGPVVRRSSKLAESLADNHAVALALTPAVNLSVRLLK